MIKEWSEEKNSFVFEVNSEGIEPRQMANIDKMFTEIKVYVKTLHIAHCLYRGAYSGLCCGNVYRDKGQCDGKNDRYDLGDKVFPVIHAHTYHITVLYTMNEPEIDLTKELDEFFDKYENTTCLTPDNPISELFKGHPNFHIWDENPTAEYMACSWCKELTEKFGNKHIRVSVEETSHNLVRYSEYTGWTIVTNIELPVAFPAFPDSEDITPLTGSNIFVTVELTSNKLDENGMVIDFKKMKKILHEVFNKYDHSLILPKDCKLAKAYKENFEKNGIDYSRSRIYEIPVQLQYSKMEGAIKGLFDEEVRNAFKNEFELDSVNVKLEF